jgi:hypothetical protein
MTQDKSELDKFKEAACDIGADDDTKRVEKSLRKLVKHKPVEKLD